MKTEKEIKEFLVKTELAYKDTVKYKQKNLQIMLLIIQKILLMI